MRFREEGVRHFLVVDDSSCPLGVITQTDVIQNQGIEYFILMREVKAIVKSAPAMIPGTLSLSDAARRMHELRLDALVVEGKDGALGILTERDVLRFISARQPASDAWEVASKPLITVPENSSLYHARDIFTESRITKLKGNIAVGHNRYSTTGTSHKRNAAPFVARKKLETYIVAHNGRDFDRPLIEAAFSQFGLKLPATPWLDTQYDVDYPRNCASRNLIYLAGFHGMVNPFQHRAVTDVLTMLTILARYDIQQVIANSLRKWLIVQANVSYDERERAKEKGFRWQSDGGKSYEKCWVKRVREEQLATLQGECDFNLTVLERL